MACLALGVLVVPLGAPLGAPSAAANEPAVITVTGGEISDSGGYRYHAFTHEGEVGASTESSLIVSGAAITNADVLVVAGGGGGGRNRAGGGGAGGLLVDEDTAISASTHSVVVGGGGKGGSQPNGGQNQDSWEDDEASPGCQGESSSFLTLDTVGGGGGGAGASSASWVDCDDNPLPKDHGANGGDGGSGGGGGYGYINGTGGEGTAGQGNDGADAPSSPGGGGGGAGAPATDKNGGVGLTSLLISAMGLATGYGDSQSGDVYFAGGAGGFSGGTGGLGGGGASGTAGAAHTGGGGGACQSTSCSGGSPGGSGVVIVRYQAPTFSALTEPYSPGDTLELTIASGAGLDSIAVSSASAVSVLNGSLPPGISLTGMNNTNDAIDFAGSATRVGVYSFTLRVFKDDPNAAPTVVSDLPVEVTIGNPTNSESPSVSGTVAPGSTLTADPGVWQWDGDALTASYQWQLDGIDITGATDSTYTIPLSVTAGQYRAVVTQSANGKSGSEASSAVGFDPNSRLIVEEDFSSPLGDDWTLTGSAEVTAGSLQLTPAEGSRSGAAFYNIPQQTTAGIDATFRINQRDGETDSQTGADGMTFFLKQGDNSSTTPGPSGSRLGFAGIDANDNPGVSNPGISGALIGVGFDREGAFVKADRVTDAGDFTCPSFGGTTIVNSSIGQGGNSTVRNNLTLRGPGEGGQGYCKLAEGVSNSTTVWQDTERTIRVKYDPNASPASNQIRIWVDNIADDDNPLLSAEAPQELRDEPTFKFGFTGSTGGRFNLHEVLEVRIESVSGLAPLAPRDGQSVPAAVANGAYFYDLSTLVSGGVGPFSFSVTEGSLPPGLSVNSPLQGIPTTPGVYSFTVTARDSRPGDLQGVVQIPVSMQVDAGQQITFPALADQQLARGTVAASASTSLIATGSLAGLPVSYTSSTTSVCTVDSSGTITLVDRGVCDITASQAGGTLDGFDVSAAEAVQRSFTVADSALASLTLSQGTLSPALDPARTSYSVSVPNTVNGITLSATPRLSGATMTLNGDALLAGQTSARQSLEVGSNSLGLVVTDGSVSQTVTITVTRAAAPGQNNNRPRAPEAEPPSLVPSAPGVFTIPQRAPAPSPGTVNPPAGVRPGPVIVGNQPPRPGNRPTATVGGVPTVASKSPIGNSGVRVSAGSVDIGIRVPTGQGPSVRGKPGGAARTGRPERYPNLDFGDRHGSWIHRANFPHPRGHQCHRTRPHRCRRDRLIQRKHGTGGTLLQAGAPPSAGK